MKALFTFSSLKYYHFWPNIIWTQKSEISKFLIHKKFKKVFKNKKNQDNYQQDQNLKENKIFFEHMLPAHHLESKQCEECKNS